jgi:aminoglycoside phosphotransferase (APT) family kinase protein
VRRHRAGHSNETLFVTWGDRELVVRRPPPGEVAETAHDVLREYRVMSALAGTDVPLPPVVLACEDHDVLGSDFYVMERLTGDVLRETEPDWIATPANRGRVGEELVDTLARIHEVDYESVGLGEFGRPGGFTERQVARWTKQLDWAREVTAEERAVPALRGVGEWLAENVPEEYPRSLVHGDYKLDNVMLAPAGSDPTRPSGESTAAAPERGASPELVAVFDWELSTLGDPHTDLGWLLAFWHDEGDPEPAVPALMATFMAREGYPTRGELVERYEARTGRSFEHDRFYRALAVYKLAGLGEMFFRRHLEGNSSDPLYPTMREGVPRLADRAERIIDGDEPL